jgi:hypothetical protein
MAIIMNSTKITTKAITKTLPGPKPRLNATRNTRPITPLKSRNPRKRIADLIISPPFNPVCIQTPGVLLIYSQAKIMKWCSYNFKKKETGYSGFMGF